VSRVESSLKVEEASIKGAINSGVCESSATQHDNRFRSVVQQPKAYPE
jgi:hypothetical protein